MFVQDGFLYLIVTRHWQFLPGIEPGPPRWEVSTLAKSYSKSELIAIPNTYMSPGHYLFFCIYMSLHVCSAYTEK
jgi:hypothetical protein